MTLDGTAITTTATLSTGISNGNLPVFTTGVADDDFLRVAGTAIEGRSASEVLSDIGGQASLTFGISNTNAVKIDSASVADDEYARFTASGLESRSTAEVLSDIGASPVAGSGSIVTTGALDAGSITSGFGSIDNGSSAITTTGTVSAGEVALSGHLDMTDSGIIKLGSDDDLLIKHDGLNGSIVNSTGDLYLSDADGNIYIQAKTGEQSITAFADGAVNLYHNNAKKLETTATGITVTGTITGGTVEATTDTAAGDSAAIGYTAAEGLILTGQGTTSDVTIKNDADQTVLSIPTGTTNVGIGNTAPATKLDVAGNMRFSAGNPVLEFNSGGPQIYVTAANTLQFATGGGIGSAVERMRIDSSGNVGIGTSSPTKTLDIDGQLRIRNGGTTGYALLEYGASSTATNNWHVGSEGDGSFRFYNGVFGSGSERMRIDSSGNVGIGTSSPEAQLHVKNGGGNSISILGQYGTGTKAQIAAYSNQVDISAYNGTNDIMTFTTGGSERMRIRANGQVLINQTSIIGSDNAYLQATGGSVTPVALKGGTNNYFMAFYNTSNSLIGSITGSTGSITYYNTTSDYRLKENVNYTWDATSQLKQLKPAKFNFIADPDNTVDGFIAHEVQEVVPHAVTGEKDGKEMQVIDHSKLVPLLTASLQEALKRIDSLEEQVNALKGK
jgi:hypothetical protein